MHETVCSLHFWSSPTQSVQTSFLPFPLLYLMVFCCIIKTVTSFLLFKTGKFRQKDFFTFVSKPLLLLAFLKASCDVHGTPYPVSAWEEKMNYHTLPATQHGKSLWFFLCISNSRQIESIVRLRLLQVIYSKLLLKAEQSSELHQVAFRIFNCIQ